MWSWINKNHGGLTFVVLVVSTIGGGIYWSVTTILELKNNQSTDREHIQALEKRIIFLERVKMLSPMKDKLDITSLAQNSVDNKLSDEQFNETLGIIKNEAPKKAMKILEGKSYFKKEQIPSIFTNQLENKEDK